MKTKEELKALKNEVEELNKKLADLTDDELEQVTGGDDFIPIILGLGLDLDLNGHNIVRSLD